MKVWVGELMKQVRGKQRFKWLYIIRSNPQCDARIAHYSVEYIHLLLVHRSTASDTIGQSVTSIGSDSGGSSGNKSGEN